jgi:DivIVA domain-containing protein
MKKKDTTAGDTSGWSSAPSGRVTPLDVQQKEFHVTRIGAGYRMREVDEFLDQVTDTLSTLIAENERLRGGGSQVAPSAQPNPPPMSADGTDRMAVEAFLRREKGFLQDLGGLVQAHAEELRTMVRGVRSAVPGSAGGAAPEAAEPEADEGSDASTGAPRGVASAAAGGAAASAAIGEVAAGEASDQPREPTEASEEAHEEEETFGTDSGASEESDESAADDDVDHEPTITRVAADEPIRVEEPEPARSRRSDEDDGDSLRELFWGEE